MELNTKQIGRRVASLRSLQSVSQRELARLAHVSHASVVNVEGGRKKGIQLVTILKIADALGVGIDELLKPIERKGES